MDWRSWVQFPVRDTLNRTQTTGELLHPPTQPTGKIGIVIQSGGRQQSSYLARRGRVRAPVCLLNSRRGKNSSPINLSRPNKKFQSTIQNWWYNHHNSLLCAAKERTCSCLQIQSNSFQAQFKISTSHQDGLVCTAGTNCNWPREGQGPNSTFMECNSR